jgi:NADH dehydrogenase
VQRYLAEAFDLNYDQLVLALGAVPNCYRTPGIEEHALTMKTLGDAILLRNRLIEALAVADNHPDETEYKAMLTIVLAGGGFAGAEGPAARPSLVARHSQTHCSADPFGGEHPLSPGPR